MRILIIDDLVSLVHLFARDEAMNLKGKEMQPLYLLDEDPRPAWPKNTRNPTKGRKVPTRAIPARAPAPWKR